MLRLVLLLIALALVAAGCGGDDTETTAPAKTAAPAGQSAGGGAGVQIKMQNIQFAPAEAEAKVGEQVVWTNEDDAPHNVVGGPIKSETFGKGETFEYTPEKAGTIEYVCTIHPGMKGTLTVTAG